MFIYEKGGSLLACLVKLDLQRDIFFTMSTKTCPSRGNPLRGFFNSAAVSRACVKSVHEMSLEKLWFLQSKPAPSLAQRSAGSHPVVLCLLLAVSRVLAAGAVLLLQGLCVKLLLYQAVETGELCRSGLKSPDSRSCQEVEPGGKCSPFL